MWQRDYLKEHSFLGIVMLLVVCVILGGGTAAVGALLGTRSVYIWAAMIGILVFVVVIACRADTFLAALLVAIHLYVDWYLALYMVGLVMALVLLLSFYLMRSFQHPWVEPPLLGLWGLFLLLTIVPALQGATNLYDTTYYYPNLIFGSLIICWIGSVVAQDRAALHRLLTLVAAIGTLVALHSIIQELTGVFLLATAHYDAFLDGVSNYQIIGSDTNRVGSFFVDPNWNGTFLAMMLCLVLGLFAACTSLLSKILYLAQAGLLIVALLFTFSTGALVGAIVGVGIFSLVAGRLLYRIALPALVLLAVVGTILLFPSLFSLQVQHASGTSELSLRIGAWTTALHVIEAFPFSGVGLGLYTYLAKSAPYQVPAQTLPLAHPHNSYLEWGAMAGIPVLLVFLTLLFSMLWLALRNWFDADPTTRSLLGGGIAAAVTLTINSVSINGWTLPPLATLGWLILGAIASPLLKRGDSSPTTKENAIERVG